MKTFANIFITIFALTFVLSAPVYSNNPTLPKATYVNVEEVKKWEKEGKAFTFIDVRAPVEYEAGHLKDAINMEYNKIETHVKEFVKDKPYVFYCTYSAWRAPYAANVLADLGFKNSFILEGGISAWNAGGQVIYAVNPNADGYIAPYPNGLIKQLDHPADKVYTEKIYLTLEELSKFDGKDGHPAYVAVNGVIYDLTQSRLWRGGVHDPSKGKATAGRDLTEVLKDSPHGDRHLKDFPIVGYLKSPPAFFEISGMKYKLQDGNVYEFKNGNYVFSQKLYDPDFVKKTWQTVDGVLYVVSESGQRYVVRRDFADGFEEVKTGASGLKDLINENRQWTAVTLLSPASPNISAYVALQKKILGGGDFIDNRVEPSSVIAHSGKQSLRLLTVKGRVELNKASIETAFAHFVKGDDYWYSGWYYLIKGRPLTLMDLETSYIQGGPGFRIFVGERDSRVGVELKWANRPTFYGDAVLTQNKWVNIKLHLKLLETQEGLAAH